MRVAVVYVFPNLSMRVYEPLAKRFVRTYLAWPPGLTAHEIHIVSNGYPLHKSQHKIFEPLPFIEHEHDNIGKDIGAYQHVAEELQDADLMLCFGAHTYFWRPGWLDRIVDVFLRHGPGLYGFWAFHEPAHHVRTTAFFLTPGLLRNYPHWIGDPQRYQFEHDPKTSITAWCRKVGFPTLQVTWREVLDFNSWRHLHPTEMLLLDQFSGEKWCQ